MSEKTCIGKRNNNPNKFLANCENCELNKDLICSFSKDETIKFVIGNGLYRITALIIFYLCYVMIPASAWLFWFYLIINLLNFLLIEPRLLCSHCPFYELDGKVLKCGGLYGMPKIWKFRPYPMSKAEKISMLIVGSTIDLMPMIGILAAYTFFFTATAEFQNNNTIILVAITIFSVVFMAIAYIFSKVLLGYRCKKCPHLSCPMNKVPDDVKDKFLSKNSEFNYKNE